MPKIYFSKDSEKFLRKVPDKHKKQIALKILELQNKNGAVHDSKQLKGSTFLRTDVGEYRIIYEVEEDTILFIALVGKRNDDEVYKRFQRKPINR